MVFNEMKHKWFWINLFISTFAVAIIVVLVNRVLPIQVIGYPILEWMLFAYVAWWTAYFYTKYHNNALKGRLSMVGRNKLYLHINIFTVVFIFGAVLIAAYLLTVIVLDHVMTLNTTIENSNRFGWHQFDFHFFFIIASIELVMIFIFNYFLNHLVKNKNVFWGIIVLVSIYLLLFGNLFVDYTQIHETNGKAYISMVSDKYKRKILVHSIIFPWTSFGMIGKNLFSYTGTSSLNYFNLNHINDFFGTTYSSYYKTIEWTSIGFLAGLNLIPLVIMAWRRKLPLTTT